MTIAVCLSCVGVALFIVGIFLTVKFAGNFWCVPLFGISLVVCGAGPDSSTTVIELVEPYVLTIGGSSWFVQSHLTTHTRSMTPLTERQEHVYDAAKKQLATQPWFNKSIFVMAEFPTDEQIRYRGVDYFIEQVVARTIEYYKQNHPQNTRPVPRPTQNTTKPTTIAL